MQTLLLADILGRMSLFCFFLLTLQLLPILPFQPVEIALEDMEFDVYSAGGWANNKTNCKC